MKITFWGVRGSKPTPGNKTILYGGNTSCVQVQCGNRTIIFDGGTGLVELGNHLILEQEAAVLNGKGFDNGIKAEIFFSHLHWDHIQGMPFFVPMYQPGNHFIFYGEDKMGLTFQEIIERQMEPPHFPVTMESMQADYEFRLVIEREIIDLGDGIKIKSFATNHPNGCFAYRLFNGDTSVVYCTDTEPIEGKNAQEFLEFLHGADVLIYDAHYSDDEYRGCTEESSKIGWGHSTWEEGTRISKAARIGQLVLYHHKENRSDMELQQIEISARQLFANTVAAREGMMITVGGD